MLRREAWLVVVDLGRGLDAGDARHRSLRRDVRRAAGSARQPRHFVPSAGMTTEVRDYESVRSVLAAAVPRFPRLRRRRRSAGAPVRMRLPRMQLRCAGSLLRVRPARLLRGVRCRAAMSAMTTGAAAHVEVIGTVAVPGHAVRSLSSQPLEVGDREALVESNPREWSTSALLWYRRRIGGSSRSLSSGVTERSRHMVTALVGTFGRTTGPQFRAEGDNCLSPEACPSQADSVVSWCR